MIRPGDEEIALDAIRALNIDLEIHQLRSALLFREYVKSHELEGNLDRAELCVGRLISDFHPWGQIVDDAISEHLARTGRMPRSDPATPEEREREEVVERLAKRPKGPVGMVADRLRGWRP